MLFLCVFLSKDTLFMYVVDLLTILISKVPSHHFHVTLVIGSMPPDQLTHKGDYRDVGPRGGVIGSYFRSYLSPNPFPFVLL